MNFSSTLENVIPRRVIKGPRSEGRSISKVRRENLERNEEDNLKQPKVSVK